MRILLCNPVRYTIYDVENQLQPLGMLYIASVLRQHMDEPVEFSYCNWEYEQTFHAFKPDVVFIPTITPYYNIEMKVAERYKELDRDIPVVVGAYHVTALPHTMTEHMDVGVLGEGDHTTLDLLQHFDQKSTVKGICYWTGGTIVVNEPRPMIPDLDVLPFPARDVVAHLIKPYDFTDIITSRGCPYRCVFCASTNFWRTVRFHSAEYVVREILDITTKYTRRINFVDDLFTINKKRLRRIVALVEEHKLDLEINTSARADTLDEEICQLLKRLGINNLCFGFESMSPRVLKYLKGGNITPDANIQAVKLCQKYGIGITANFVIGNTYETREEILMNLEFAKHGGLRYVIANVVSPLPLTPLWDEAKQRGLVSDDMDWEKLNFCLHNPTTHEKTVIMSKVLSRDEIYDLWKKFDDLNRWLTLKDQLRVGFRHPIRACRYVWQRLRWRLP